MPNTVPCIAVVDDEEPVRVMIGRLLRLGEYQVATFGSGEEFLAALAGSIPKCVILDVHMPGLSGLDVQARLRAMGIDIPAIFITASDDFSLEEAVRKAHGVALLRKPFSRKELLATVGATLQDSMRGAS